MTGRSARRAQYVGCQHAGVAGYGRPSDRGEGRHGFAGPGRLRSLRRADRMANLRRRWVVRFEAKRRDPLAAPSASYQIADE